MKRTIALMLIAVMLLGVLAACSSQSAAPAEETTDASQTTVETETAKEDSASKQEPEAEANERYKIGIFVKDTTTSGWRYIVQAAMEAGEELGVDVIEYAPLDNTDSAAQIAEVEDALQSGIDAICIAAIDAEAIKPALQKAIDQGVPVITTNTRVDLDGISAFVGTDNEAAGTAISEALFESMDYEGNVVILEVDSVAVTPAIRVAACEKVMEKYPDLKLVTKQPAYGKRENGMSVMENILQTYDDIDAVWCANEPMALGAAQAIIDAGRTNIKITGIDGTPEAAQAVLDGKLTFTCDQGLFGQGSEPIRAAVKILNGETVDKEIPTGGTIITPENAAEFLAMFE